MNRDVNVFIRRIRVVRLVSMLFGLAGSMAAATNEASVSGMSVEHTAGISGKEPKEKVVDLPVFRVEEKADLPPREEWRYGAIPGFEILSNASDKVTHEWVQDIQTALQIGEIVWPITLASNRSNILILCKDFKSCADFVPDVRKRGPASPSLTTVSDWEHYINIGNAAGIPRFKGWQGRTWIYAYQSRQSEPRPPIWMTMCVSRIMHSATIFGDELRYGALDPDLERLLLLSSMWHRAGDIRPHRPPPPLRKAFDLNRGDLSWPIRSFQDFPGAFMPLVYLSTVGHPDRYQVGFLKFINRARLEPVTEKLFEECFDQSLPELDKAILAYVDQVIGSRKLPIKVIKGLKFEHAPLELRDATDAEVGRIKGEALALLRRPKISPRLMLHAPYVRGERDPQLLAAIGLHERKLGNETEARRFLEAAVHYKVNRPRAYVELARMRYQESLNAPAGLEGTLNAAQLQPIMELLEVARALSPQIPEVYDLIAEVAAHSEMPAMRQYLTVIDEGLHLFPYHAELLCQGAAAFAHAGRFKDAAKLVEYGRSRFRYYEPTYCERLEQLQATLPAS